MYNRKYRTFLLQLFLIFLCENDMTINGDDDDVSVRVSSPCPTYFLKAINDSVAISLCFISYYIFLDWFSSCFCYYYDEDDEDDNFFFLDENSNENISHRVLLYVGYCTCFSKPLLRFIFICWHSSKKNNQEEKEGTCHSSGSSRRWYLMHIYYCAHNFVHYVSDVDTKIYY